MRINVYAEELTTEVRTLTKRAERDTGGSRTFSGLRIMLAAPAELADEDRPAVTIWYEAGQRDAVRVLLESLVRGFDQTLTITADRL